MKNNGLKFEDLIPQESTFTLSEKQGKVYILKKFTLADQIWAKREFGDRLQAILETVDLEGIAKLVFHLLKNKEEFKDELSFMEVIVTPQDKINILKALLATIGVSQPILDKLEKDILSPNE